MAAEKREKRARGFVFVDLAAVLVVGLFTAGLLLVCGAETRRQAGLGECIQRLRQLGVATSSYAADHVDLIWTFSWKAGDRLSEWDDLNEAISDLQAAANHAVDILRRRVDPSFPRITGWVPHVSYNQLVLGDYWDWGLPHEAAACPNDDVMRCLQANWDEFCSCDPRPPCSGASKRWPFASSYEIGPAFYAADGAIAQGSRHSFFFIRNGAVFGGKTMGSVRYPSKKAMVWETTARHFGQAPIWFAYEEARLPVLTADGAVAVRATADANKGWHPFIPDDPNPSVFLYTPAVWEAPTLNGSREELVVGHYRWTRGGLAGRDFGGPEVWE